MLLRNTEMKMKTGGQNLNSKQAIKLSVLLVAALIVGIFLTYENKHLVVTGYEFTAEGLENFEAYRIVQISDLHNALFGKDNSKLIDRIKELEPDMIVFTGDFVDANHTNIDRALAFANEAATIAPSYYITGNHEYWLDNEERNQLFGGFKTAGVVMLNNEKLEIANGDKFFNLIGIDDMALGRGEIFEQLQPQMDGYNVVLAHEPQYLNWYSQLGADIVLTGHAHGGQFRFPFIGAVYAPNQGLNPELTEGVHKSGKTHMVISRGLGNSTFPFRLFNDPEIVYIDIK